MRRAAVLLALAAGVLASGGCGGSGSTATHGQRAPARHAVTAPHTTPRRPAAPAPRSLPVRGAAARRLAVPILMYHVIGTPPAGQGLPELWVSRERFAAEVALLARRGYEAVTLAEVFDAWEGRGGLPRRPVVLSFDDGYLSDGTFVARTLRDRGWPGVLNLETHNLGPDGLPRHLAKRMAADGWEIDSHTVDHPDLTTVDAARLRSELVDSRDQIRQEFGATPQFFCYPAGKYDATVIAAVKAAGYRGATTELPGAARHTDDPYELPRIRVNGSDTPAALLAELG